RGDKFLKAVLRLRASVPEDIFPDLRGLVEKIALAVMAEDRGAKTRGLVVDLQNAVALEQDLLLKSLPVVSPDEAASVAVATRGRTPSGLSSVCASPATTIEGRDHAAHRS